MYKIGQGIDIHKIELKKTSQKLGGINFLLDYKIVAHSDGDIIYHSISSAILGALSLSDIGTYFSDQDKKNKNIDSFKILNFCLQELKKQKYEIVNLDINVVCEKIIFKDIKKEIINHLKGVFKNENVSLKATRFEQDKDFIECHTIIMIKKIVC